jgi:hypothetical protein
MSRRLCLPLALTTVCHTCRAVSIGTMRLLMLLAWCASAAHGWWDAGHMLTAAVAENLLQPQALQGVRETLNVLRSDYPYASTFVGAAHCAPIPTFPSASLWGGTLPRQGPMTSSGRATMPTPTPPGTSLTTPSATARRAPRRPPPCSLPDPGKPQSHCQSLFVFSRLTDSLR